MIKKFRGKYYFLSNMYDCKVEFEGLTYMNAEAAFQSAKTLDIKEREKFTKVDGFKAKDMGGKVKLRKDWDIGSTKYDIMYKILKSKFSNDFLKRRLISTKLEYLEEGNYYHDNYWGVCYCKECSEKVSLNLLGQLLMKLRNELSN